MEQGPEKKSTSYKENQKEKFRYNCADSEYSESSEEKKATEKEGGRKKYNNTGSSK
jgi:hypothetical protein